MRWRRFTLLAEPREIETASALLNAATGAHTAVIVNERRGAGARARIEAYVPLRAARSAAARLSDVLRRARRARLLTGPRLRSAVVRDLDWSAAWKGGFAPFQAVRGLFVLPPWPTKFRVPSGSSALVIDPRMAFGTGKHASTRLALRLMLPLVEARSPMLDIGCGSGILGIAAAQRGALVFACDTDPIAIREARANFRRNGEKPVKLVRAPGVPPSFPTAPLVTANITADVLMDLAPRLRRATAPGGYVVTSGVTERRRLAFLRAFAAAGLRKAHEHRSGEWLAFVHVNEAG